MPRPKAPTTTVGSTQSMVSVPNIHIPITKQVCETIITRQRPSMRTSQVCGYSFDCSSNLLEFFSEHQKV